jgi:hypothetical protein
VQHDLALLTLRGLRWEVLQFRGVPPAPRASHVGVAVGARLWVFGGAAADGRLLNDVHFAELPKQAAPAAPPRAAAPPPPGGQPPRAAAAATAAAAAQAVAAVAFGGVAVRAAAMGKPPPPRLLAPPPALLMRAGPALTRPLPTAAIERLWPVHRRPAAHAAHAAHGVVVAPAACPTEVNAVSVRLEPVASVPPERSAAGLGSGEGSMEAGPTTPTGASPEGIPDTRS